MSKWEMVRLGDVGEVITGSTPPTSNRSYYESDDIQFYKPNDFKESVVNKLKFSLAYVSHHATNKIRLFPKGSVLTTCIGSIGKVGVLDNEATGNQQINAIIPNRRKVISVFLAYSILSKNNHLKDKANAPVVPIINKTQFANVQIPLPPLEVQQKIAETLDAAAELLALRKQQLAEMDNLIKAVFYEMFGDPVTNEKGWDELKWDDVFNTQTGKLDANAMCENGIYPFFTCAKESYLINEYAFDCEALLLAGNNATANYDVKHYKGKFNAYQRTYVLTIKNACNKYSVFKVLLEEKLKQLQKESKGTNTKYLTLGILKRLNFVSPPLPLQNQFAAIVTKIEEQKALVQMAIDESQYLFDSLMNEYFN